MNTTTVDVWSEVRRLRREAANRIVSLEPRELEAPSWCGGWRVRDVLGHLVHLAEATQLSILRDVMQNGGRPDRAIRRIARCLGDESVVELAERLRKAAGGRYHMVGTPRSVVMGEVLVHTCDALRPIGIVEESPAEDVALLLDVYRRLGRLAFHAAPQRGVCLVATDLDWRRGNGPEVRGKAIDLLLLMANRRQVIDTLEGPGIAALSK